MDDVFLDERDAVTYIGVEMGFFGTNPPSCRPRSSGSTTGAA